MVAPENEDEAAPAVPAAAPAAARPLLTGPKRQHFLPRFYLEGFTKNGMLAVYDRETDEVRMQQPVNTGVVGHFYTLEDAAGRKRFELEAFLADREGAAQPVMSKLRDQQVITADERSELAIFVALAAFRTPEIIDSVKAVTAAMMGDLAALMFADVQQVKERMRTRPGAPETEEELEAEARDLVEFARRGNYRIETDHRWAVGLSIDVALKLAPVFAARNWLVVHRPDERKSYVTTDAPVLLSTVVPRQNNFWGIGFGNADALVAFPLDQSCVLAMFGDGGALVHHVATAEAVRETNLALADRCQRFVIGRDEALVRSLADYFQLAKKKWKPKFERH